MKTFTYMKIFVRFFYFYTKDLGRKLCEKAVEHQASDKTANLIIKNYY